AGWSAAIIISRPWSPSREVGRRRFVAASAIAAGRVTRVATRSRKRWSSTGGLLVPRFDKLGLDLVHGRHRVGARQAPRDDRTGRIAEPHAPLQIPSSEKGVTQGPAERVACPEAVDHVDR